MEEAVFDRIADVYDATRRVPQAAVKLAFDWVLHTTALPPDAVVLDVGVGTGRVIGPLLDHASSVIGIDVSRNMMKKLREKVKRGVLRDEINLVLADAHNLPFRTALFDLIAAAHVMPFLNHDKFLAEARRVLKPHGYLVRMDESEDWGRLNRLANRKVEMMLPGREIWKRKLAKLLGEQLTEFGKLLLGFFRGRRIARPIRPNWRRQLRLRWRESISAASYLTKIVSGSSFIGLPQAVREKAVLELVRFAESEFGAGYAENAEHQLTVTLFRL